MQRKTTFITAASLAVGMAGLIGWQGWHTHQLQQQVAQLQQQVVAQSGNATTPQSLSNINPAGSGDPFRVGQDPFADMQRMQEEMHQLMSGLGMGSMGFGADPEFDFSENADDYQLSIAIPDNSRVEVNTEVNGRDLTIEGKVTVEQQNQAGSSGFRSMQTRQFARTLTLPADVDPLGITNQTTNGQVVITLPKQQSNQLGNQQIPSGPQV